MWAVPPPGRTPCRSPSVRVPEQVEGLLSGREPSLPDLPQILKGGCGTRDKRSRSMWSRQSEHEGVSAEERERERNRTPDLIRHKKECPVARDGVFFMNLLASKRSAGAEDSGKSGQLNVMNVISYTCNSAHLSLLWCSFNVLCLHIT